MDEIAIQVSSAYKQYEKGNAILQGLDMTVCKGSMYGLLGPSGCGKTTLINCIVGLDYLDSGIIKVSTEKKSDIGYMPQEISLYTGLTIIETFEYFGTVFNKNKNEIRQQGYELGMILDLPNMNSLVVNLSGGQQRRVSLAVSLIHSPPILIMDEPTVGVDPVIRAKVWDHLLYLCNHQQKTIIVTTHYVEETIRANKVGLLREGKLLCEESPTILLEKYCSDTLENVFLKLSHNQLENKAENQQEMPKNSAMKTKVTLYRTSSFFSFSNCFAELKKNVFFLSRNIPVMIFLISMSVFSTLFFNLANGHDPEMIPIGLVNEEFTGGVSGCSNISNIIGVGNDTCDVNLLSCKYINLLRNMSIHIIEYNELSEGMKNLAKNSVWSLIHFPLNFTESLIERIDMGRYASETTITYSTINIYSDKSNRIIAQILDRKFIKTLGNFVKQILQECKWRENAGDPPVRINSPIYGDSEGGYSEFASPGIVMLLAFTLTHPYVVIVLMEEKTNRVANRCLVAGMKVLEILVSHFIVSVSILSAQIIGIIVVHYYFFGHAFGQPILSVTLIFVTGIAGIFMALMVATFFDSLSGAASASFGYTLALSFLGGIFWPVEGMPEIMRILVKIALPTASGAESLRSLNQRFWGISHFRVAIGFISASTWIGIFAVLIYLILKSRGGRFVA